MFTLEDTFLLLMPVLGGLLGAYFRKRNNPLGMLMSINVMAFVYVCCPLACWLTKYALDGWYAPRPQAVFWLVILSPRGD